MAVPASATRFHAEWKMMVLHSERVLYLRIPSTIPMKRISVVGQEVAVGQRIGAMGSTGRSTGTHLHYEVWVNGRPENPLRFVKAGDYVQQTKF